MPSLKAVLLFNGKNGFKHETLFVYQVIYREVFLLYSSNIYYTILPHSLSSFSSQLAFAEGQSEGPKVGLDCKELLFLVQITCQVLLYYYFYFNCTPHDTCLNGFCKSRIVSRFLCQGRNWLVKRSYEDFRVLDKHLHLCIYDRRYSQLAELPRYNILKDTVEVE